MTTCSKFLQAQKFRCVYPANQEPEFALNKYIVVESAAENFKIDCPFVTRDQIDEKLVVLVDRKITLYEHNTANPPVAVCTLEQGAHQLIGDLQPLKNAEMIFGFSNLPIDSIQSLKASSLDSTPPVGTLRVNKRLGGVTCADDSWKSTNLTEQSKVFSIGNPETPYQIRWRVLR